ncbi:MAG: type VI secretion system baseplate subunit TssG, partial [Pseudomonadota bacterium]
EQIKTSSGLRQILEEHFKVPIKIREFIGQWQELIDDVRSKLPQGKSSSGQNNRLGKSAMLGRKGWLAQGKFSVIIGPLNSTQLEDFSPGTKALKAMNEIVRLYAGMEYDYDFKIQIKKYDIPNRVKLDSKNSLCMGWNAWLAGKENKNISDNETMEISISAVRLM